MGKKLSEKHPELFNKINQGKAAKQVRGNGAAPSPERGARHMDNLYKLFGEFLELYYERGGKKDIADLMKTDRGFRVAFYKEFLANTRKLVDVEAAKVRAQSAAEGNGQGTGPVTQNFFIIKGLHDGNTHTKQVSPEDMEAIEAEFRPIGLSEGTDGG